MTYGYDGYNGPWDLQPPPPGPFQLLITIQPTPENASGGGASGTPFVSVDIAVGMDRLSYFVAPTPENAGSDFISAVVELRT